MKNEKLRIIAIFLLMISLVCVAMSFVVSWVLGIFIATLVLITIIVSFFVLKAITEDTTEYISDLSYRIKRGEQESLIKMPVGIMFLNGENEIEWVNPYLQKYFGQEEVLGKALSAVDKELAAVVGKYGAEKKPVEVSWREYRFQLLIENDIHAVYLMDITRYAKIEQHDKDTDVVIGQIFIDNYDEVTQTMNDKSVSNISNYVTNELSNWAKKYQMYLKRIDDDHFFILAYASVLEKLEEDKFKILDRIRERTSKQNLPLTLSMGISYGEDDLALLSKTAQNNLDLALGRGGDQVVVKTPEQQARFYGGKTNPMEKRTRVRARMIAQALQELMSQTDQVFVMGHKYPDMDSIGACLGLRRIAAMNQKKMLDSFG